MAKGALHISEPGAIIPHQDRLFEAPGFRQTQLRVFPEVERSQEALDDILATGGLKGLDLEFNGDPFSDNYLKPSICAVTSLERIYCVPWSDDYAERLYKTFTASAAPDGTPYHWVAHSTVGADKAVIDKALGITTHIDSYSDSMATHFLANQHLCKSPNREESDDAGSLGFNDLWTTASLVTDLSRWKYCKGSVCPGPDPGTPMYSRLAPCPTHSPCSYCGIDAWVSPVTHKINWATLESMGLQSWYYREFMELLELCWLMEQKGVKVNLRHVVESNKYLDDKKDKLFEYELVNKKKIYKLFNPNSGPQVKAFFAERKVQLKKTDKDHIREALDKLALSEGVPLGFAGLTDDYDGALSDTLVALLNLDTYKSEGKGLDPWYGEQYFEPAYHKGLKSLGIKSIYDVPIGSEKYEEAIRLLEPVAIIHPRMQATGTSSGRKSSSKPNMQNPAKRGFGELVRRAVVAHESD